MIRTVTITNYVGDSIELELTKPEDTGFIVMSIDGLGPVKASINVTEVTTNDGGIFNSARSSYRNIVMHLRFTQTKDESIEDIRQKSYKYFPLKKSVTLLIKTDNRELKTTGYVESNEPNIFSENEGCDISIICPDPYLYSTKSNVVFFAGMNPNFEFPFENNSLNEPLLEMGIIQEPAEQTIVYEGETEIGIEISIHATGTASNIDIYNIVTREKMSINTDILEALTGSAIMAGDTIRINTKKNHKGIVLIRDGVEFNILNSLSKGSKWFTLYKGSNTFAFTAATGRYNLEFSIANDIIYDGV